MTFRPILKDRIWGGTKLGELYGKPLPQGALIGESWEISDRPADVSTITNGALAGHNLHWLVQHHAQQLMGNAKLQAGHFPLLLKLLDCQQTLSLQVHPPAAKAAQLGGEPKTEMWYIAEAMPRAELYVGLKRGVTPKVFEQKTQSGTVAECFHRVGVRAGDAMFLPSGRVHAIGGGLVIFEIQQNSDTTFRVFDWNRVGLDGKPRALHLTESMASIDFNDIEPALLSSETQQVDGIDCRLLVDHELFKVETISARAPKGLSLNEPKLRILGMVAGKACVKGGEEPVELTPGQFCLIPACVNCAELSLSGGSILLNVEPGTM